MYIVFAGGQERDVSKQVIRGADQAVQAGLGQAEILHEHLRLFRIQLGDVLFELCRHRQHRRARAFRIRLQCRDVGVVLGIAHPLFVQVGRIDHRFDRQQAAVSQDILVVLRKGEVSCRFFLFQVLQQRLAHLALALVLFVPALGVLFCPVQPALDDFDIGEDQLKLEGLGIPDGIRLFQKEVVIVEAAHHLDQRIHLTDRLENLVSLSSARTDAGHIDKVDGGRAVLFRMIVFRQPVQSFIRDLGRPDVRLGRCVIIAARLRLGAGQRIKQGGLSDIRQTDNAQFHLVSHLLYHRGDYITMCLFSQQLFRRSF